MKHSQTYFTARPKRLFILLTALVLGAAFASLCLGSVSLSPAQLLAGLRGQDATAGAILLHVRLPRTLAALLAGAALAVAGAVIQSVLDNPLASPNIIGVNAGAGLGVVVCTAFFPLLPSLVPLGAFGGAVAATLLVCGIARRAGASRTTLVLTGVALNAILNAGIDAIVTLVPDALSGSTAFKIGGLSHVSLAALTPPWVVILGCLGVAMLLCRELDVLQLGEETAASLGLRTGLVRNVLLLLACALAGAAVSFAGLLGFVGLLVPHLLRRFTGSESRFLLPGCALGGAAFLTLCDLLARLLLRPFELPVGILLSLLGGPFFLYLLVRRRKP